MTSEWAKTLYFSRRHPRWSWVRLTFSTKVEPGHQWHYNGLVRRDTLSVRGVGVILQRLVKSEDAVESGQKHGRNES